MFQINFWYKGIKMIEVNITKYKPQCKQTGSTPVYLLLQTHFLSCSQACHHCQRAMNRGDPAVYAERAGFDKLWHPGCFVCCTCNELLVDMIYFWKKGKPYCGRHYGDSEKPRCGGCDEVREIGERG